MLGPGAPGAPGAPGVRASRWDGDGLPDLDNGDRDLSICGEVKPEISQIKHVMGPVTLKTSFIKHCCQF